MKTKYCLILCLTAIALFGTARTYYFLTDDFQVRSITQPVEYHKAWDVGLKEEDDQFLSSILNQKFHYLGKGAQVYAFASEDGNYVLKFFKFKHLKPSPIITYLPSIGPIRRFKQSYMERKKRKLENLFNGYLAAFRYDKKYSGLLYLHLNPTSHLNLTAEIVDKLGFKHTLDLDPIVFVVQKKGKTLRETLSLALEDSNIELAILKATQILDMYVEEYQHRLYDRDHGISHNTGFIGPHPFHLDVGKITFDVNLESSDFYKNDLRHVAKKMEEWVRYNYPIYQDKFNQKLDEHLQTLLSEFMLPAALPILP